MSVVDDDDGGNFFDFVVGDDFGLDLLEHIDFSVFGDELEGVTELFEEVEAGAGGKGEISRQE